MSLQNINSRIGVVRNAAHAESHLIKYYVFDVLMDEPFHRRLLVLNKLAQQFEGHAGVGVVKTREVTSEIEADYWYNQWKNVEGFEGMMYRDANAPYGFASRCGNKDNRWNYLLKRKEMQDMNAAIVGVNQMVDQFGELKEGLAGAFVLRSPEGATFTAGSGLTNEQRRLYWSKREELLGVVVRIRYEMLSDGGVPLKPIVECVDYVQ